jgi:anthranilate synthase component 1
MQLIDSFEPTKRSFYGGGIGMIGFNQDLNHAIMIRSFLCVNGKLYFQAGAGIVIDSQEEKELQEVNNKLAALKKALLLAQEI